METDPAHIISCNGTSLEEPKSSLDVKVANTEDQNSCSTERSIDTLQIVLDTTKGLRYKVVA